MTQQLHRISAVLFYLLAISFFVTYLLLINEILPFKSAWWLQRMDLPLALTAILYGATSFYLSLHHKESFSPVLAILIAVPLILFFIFLSLLNFWEVLGLPQGEPLLL